MSKWRNVVLGLGIGLVGLAPPLSAELPHQEYTLQSKVATVSAVTTDGVLWTPATGYRVYVLGCAVSSGGAQQTLLEINNTAIYPTIYTAADTIEEVFLTATGTADQTVTYTTSSSTTTTIICTGYEWQG